MQPDGIVCPGCPSSDTAVQVSACSLTGDGETLPLSPPGCRRAHSPAAVGLCAGVPAARHRGFRRLWGLVHRSVHPGLPAHSRTWPRQQGRVRGGGGGADVRSLHGRTREVTLPHPGRSPRAARRPSGVLRRPCPRQPRFPFQPGDSARPGRPRAWLPSYSNKKRRHGIWTVEKGDVSVSRTRHLISLLEIPHGSSKPHLGAEAIGSGD